jgi:hypothetical protein
MKVTHEFIFVRGTLETEKGGDISLRASMVLVQSLQEVEVYVLYAFSLDERASCGGLMLKPSGRMQNTKGRLNFTHPQFPKASTIPRATLHKFPVYWKCLLE